MEDGFTLPTEPIKDDGDMTRLVLQHCVMPAYQFIIQVQPEQPTVINTCQSAFICVVLLSLRQSDKLEEE